MTSPGGHAATPSRTSVDHGKRLLPQPVKQGVRRALRSWGRATASVRPLPDFLILGTKRGGTTSLWNYLLDHPGVLPMWPAAENLKSPHYFYWHHGKGVQWYRSFFPTDATRRLAARRLGHRVVAGEASPYYLYDPRVPARVSTELPDARLIVVLRDPVERAFSHYKERVRAGVEPLSFEEALAAEPERLAGELDAMRADPDYYSRPHDWYSYRDRGVYAPQLRRWQQTFPASSLLIMPSEELYADPQGTIDQVSSFLDLPPAPLRSAERWNFKPAEGMRPDTRAQLQGFYRPHNADLYRLLGRDLGWDEP